MRSEGGAADGGAGVPSDAEADTVEPVVAAESASRVELLSEGIGCATVIAAARASAEPVPLSVGMEKNKTNTVSAAGDINPRPVQPSAVATEVKTRASDESPRGIRNTANPYTWLVCANIVKFGRAEGESIQGSMLSAGH